MKQLTIRLWRQLPALLVAFTLGLATPLACVIQCYVDDRRVAAEPRPFLCAASEQHAPPPAHPALQAFYELLPAASPSLPALLLVAALVAAPAPARTVPGEAPRPPPPRAA